VSYPGHHTGPRHPENWIALSCAAERVVALETKAAHTACQPRCFRWKVHHCDGTTCQGDVDNFSRVRLGTVGVVAVCG
jgi:hypothetical protein